MQEQTRCELIERIETSKLWSLLHETMHHCTDHDVDLDGFCGPCPLSCSSCHRIGPNSKLNLATSCLYQMARNLRDAMDYNTKEFIERELHGFRSISRAFAYHPGEYQDLWSMLYSTAKVVWAILADDVEGANWSLGRLEDKVNAYRR